jgi:hypothetical protein
MSGDDLPFYETLYGMKVQDWFWSYGSGIFFESHYVMKKEYVNEGCITDDYTTLTSGENNIRLIYPYWIKRKYYIEGIAYGQITLSCYGDDSDLVSYKINLKKVDSDGKVTPLGTTDTVTPVNTIFTWDGGLSVGTEIVYYYEIDVSPEKEILNDDRLFIEIVIVTSNEYMILYHSNDATWEDLKINIPFRGL